MPLIALAGNDEQEPRGEAAAAPGRASGRAAAETPPAPLLEYSLNVVTEGDPPKNKLFQVAKCGCNCWYCCDCCERKGYSLRARLVPVLRTFTDLMMVTLTIDPMLFRSARKAYFHVRNKRGISRLVRELLRLGHLHSGRYFCVLEFQRDTQQAHFHLLIDATFVPKEAIDAAWSKLRPKTAGPVADNRPAFGMTRFSMPRFKGGAVHAARYATKYLVKTPEYGWPAWVLELGRKRRVPRYSTSRGFWGRASKPKSVAGEPRKLRERTYAERIAECGSTCNLFESTETVNAATGEVGSRMKWRARLRLPAHLLARYPAVNGNSARRISLFVQDTRVCLMAMEMYLGQKISIESPRQERRMRCDRTEKPT